MFNMNFVKERLAVCCDDEIITIVNVFNKEYEKPVFHEMEDLDSEYRLNMHYDKGFTSDHDGFIVDGNTIISMNEEDFINQYYNVDEVAEWITDLDEIGELRENVIYNDVFDLIEIPQDEFCH